MAPACGATPYTVFALPWILISLSPGVYTRVSGVVVATVPSALNGTSLPAKIVLRFSKAFNCATLTASVSSPPAATLMIWRVTR